MCHALPRDDALQPATPVNDRQLRVVIGDHPLERAAQRVLTHDRDDVLRRRYVAYPPRQIRSDSDLGDRVGGVRRRQERGTRWGGGLQRRDGDEIVQLNCREVRLDDEAEVRQLSVDQVDDFRGATVPASQTDQIPDGQLARPLLIDFPLKGLEVGGGFNVPFISWILAGLSQRLHTVDGVAPGKFAHREKRSHTVAQVSLNGSALNRGVQPLDRP